MVRRVAQSVTGGQFEGPEIWTGDWMKVDPNPQPLLTPHTSHLRVEKVRLG